VSGSVVAGDEEVETVVEMPAKLTMVAVGAL
jgi:hypothetical protein